MTLLASGMPQWKIPVMVLSELRIRITLPGPPPLFLWYGRVELFGIFVPSGRYHSVPGLEEKQQVRKVVVQFKVAAPVPISVLVTMLLLVRVIPFRVKPTPENW